MRKKESVLDKVLLICKPQNDIKKVFIHNMKETKGFRRLIGCDALESVVCEIEGKKYRILLDEDGRPCDYEENRERKISVLSASEEELFSNIIYGSIILCKQNGELLIGLEEDEISSIMRHIRRFPKMGKVLVLS